MKTLTIFALVFLFAASMLVVYGCSKQNKSFGQPITENAFTSIGSILSAPKNFEGKTVKVEGEVTDVCPAGGWFFLKDRTGTIYVNLHPSYFAIPQVRGSKAVAEGKVRKEGTQIEIIGEGVQLP